MKIIRTVTYDVERMTVKDFLADHRYRPFMEQPEEDPCPVMGNQDWLHGQRPYKKLYIVNHIAETTRMCADNQRGEQ